MAAGDSPVSNISLKTCCAMAVLIVLFSTRPTSSRRASGLNFKSASPLPGFATLSPSDGERDGVRGASAIFALRLLMTQLATALGFFACFAIFSK